MGKNEELTPVGEQARGHYVIPIPDRFDEAKIDYTVILRILSRHRWYFVSTLVGCLAISLAVAFLLPRKYEASALLASVIETPDSSGLSTLASQFGGLASLAGLDFAQSGNTAEAVAILSSRELAAEFIRKKNLMPVLFDDRWDADAGEWTVAGDKVPTMWDAVNRFTKEIRKVNLRKDDGLIHVSITWKDPAVAAAWTMELVMLANAVMREDAIVEAQKSLAYLEKRLAETSSLELQQGIYRLIESNLKRIMIASVRDEYAFKTIDAADAPDLDDYSYPNLLIILIAGLFAGIFLGVSAALWRERRTRKSAQTVSNERA